MRVIFKIEYHAKWGESLHIVGDLALDLTTVDGDVWSAEATLEPDQRCSYSYELRCGDTLVRQESDGAEHRIDYNESIEELVKYDSWCDEPILKPLRSSLFVDAIFRRRAHRKFDISKHSITLECYCERVEPHQQLVLVGEGTALGNWSVTKGVTMSGDSFPYWRASVPSSVAGAKFKFVIVDRIDIFWESGRDRIMPIFGQGYELHSLSTPQFDTPLWRGLGVSIPIFSLRTKRSWGVGDFVDLRSMVDWSVERGLSVIQVLPINDTIMLGTWEDSYPYNANSTIALHPQYLSMREVGRLADEAANRRYARRAKKLNDLEHIDYAAMITLKMEYLRDIYSEQGRATRKQRDYMEFIEGNGWWLRPYALYSFLRDKHSTPDTSKWGRDSIYSDELCDKYSRGMQFYYFVQFHLHMQLTRTVEYARKHSVALKGDIPIGISRLSVDAWVQPQLFNMSMQAGAPPDPFSNLGQNWGFPTYNWDEMSRDGYSWWRGRFQKMAEYFDAYRIDHILGFFRIWQIPLGSIHGLLGHFAPALPLSEQGVKHWGVGYDDWMTRPLITEELLSRVFSEAEVKLVRRKYFNGAFDGTYRFKDDYDNQSKLSSVDDEELRDRLMALHDEVLFVRDSVDPKRLHPRIMGMNSYPFERLNYPQKCAYTALHDHFYYQRHNEYWRDSAMQKLPVLISSTNMLVCGEDLGMIPDSVAEVMNRLQILSLEIERMPKAQGVEFGDVGNYPYLSVCTTSTHDMNTIRGWWLEDAESTQRYYNGVLGCDGVAPEGCDPCVAQSIIDRHKASPSMLTILPWQDWMALDAELRRDDVEAERINIPANSRHYWRYRMHIDI